MYLALIRRVVLDQYYYISTLFLYMRSVLMMLIGMTGRFESDRLSTLDLYIY